MPEAAVATLEHAMRREEPQDALERARVDATGRRKLRGWHGLLADDVGYSQIGYHMNASGRVARGGEGRDDFVRLLTHADPPGRLDHLHDADDHARHSCDEVASRDQSEAAGRLAARASCTGAPLALTCPWARPSGRRGSVPLAALAARCLWHP